MSPDAPHSRLIAQAAKSALGSIGCKQKGRSRTWYDDHGWWLGLVEFQPSSWSKGSYLNVGAMWLWNATGGWSFDFAGHNGSRVETFREFQNETQFSRAATQLANRAVEELQALRMQLASIQSAASRLASTPGSPVYCHYHAAVSAALVGDHATADVQFEVLAAIPVHAPWVSALQAKAKPLALAAHAPEKFRKLVELEVKEARRLLGLLPLPSVESLWSST
jgi:hypothetical protein